MSPLLAKRLSDETLGSRLASGEAAAFDELYRRYVHRLAAYGAHLLGDGAAGDDVAQATLLKAYTALREGRVPDRVKPWLYRIAHNVAIDLVVRRREVPFGELPEQASTDAEPVAGALVAALAALPERQRSVYVLRELHGLRIDETAAKLSLSGAQVEQALFAARNRLAEHLVFGDRLNCVAVQRLAAGPLDTDEKRALKTHLRSCGECRSGLGVRGRALSVLPVTSLEWLRGLVAGATGGGTPVVAKIGAAVATVSLGAGVPMAVETAQHPQRLGDSHRIAARAAKPTPTATTARATPRVHVAVSLPVLVSHAARPTVTTAARHGRDDGEGGRHGSATRAPVERETVTTSTVVEVADVTSGEGSSHGERTSGEVAAPAAITPFRESESGSGSNSGSSSGSGSGVGPASTDLASDGSGGSHDGGDGSGGSQDGGGSHDGGGDSGHDGGGDGSEQPAAVLTSSG